MTEPLRALPNPVLERITPDDFIKTSPKSIQLKSNPNGLLQQATRGFLARLGIATLGLSLIKLFSEQSPYDSFLENPLIEKDNLSEDEVRKLLEELYNPGADQEMLEFLQENYPELDFVTDENLLLGLGWVIVEGEGSGEGVLAFNTLDLIYSKWSEEKRTELWEWVLSLKPELAEEIEYENGWGIFATPTPGTWMGDFEVVAEDVYEDPHYEDPFAVPDFSPTVVTEDDFQTTTNWQGAFLANGEEEAGVSQPDLRVDSDETEEDLGQIIGKLRSALNDAPIDKRAELKRLLREAQELQVQEMVGRVDRNRLDSLRGTYRKLVTRAESDPTQKTDAPQKPIQQVQAGGSFVESAMAYLADGKGNKRGRVQYEDKLAIEMIASALQVHQPEDISEGEWIKITERCAKKWVTGENNLEAREFENRKNKKDLSEAIAEKVRELRLIGMSRPQALKAVHRHDVNNLRELYSQYSRTISSYSLQSDDPLETAKQIKRASDAAYELARSHPNPNIQGIARTIAVVAAHKGKQGRAKGEEFARSVIAASEAAYELASQHPNPNIQRIAGTIANAAANQAKQGRAKGEEFARAVIAASEAAYELASQHPNPNIQGVAGTIAAAAATQAKQGRVKGEGFARSVIAASGAVYELARSHPNPNIQGIAGTIAVAAAHKGKQGKSKGEEFARSVIAASEAAYEVAKKHSNPNIQGIAGTIAVAAATQGKQGRAKGEEFARSVIAASEAAYELASQHPNPNIQGIAGTIAVAAANRRQQEKTKGEEFARSVIAASEAAYELASQHPNANIQGIAGTIAGTAATQAKQGRAKGEEFARAVIAASEAAYELASQHSNPNIQGIAGTIAVVAAHEGKQGRAKGEEFARAVIAASEAAHELASQHPNPNIQGKAGTIAVTAANQGKQGKTKGEEFARAVIAASEAAHELASQHPNPNIQDKAGTIANAAANQGKQGRAKGEEFARKEIAKILGGDND